MAYKQRTRHKRQTRGKKQSFKTRTPVKKPLPPLFAHAQEPLWRLFIPCLGAAFLLRVYVGIGGDWAVRADEIWQYLEQAHRWVFGYGQVTWEFRIGARSWLLPAVSAIPLWLCKISGFTHPDVYIPAIKIWHAALSLTIPAGVYLFGRQNIGETAARLAFLCVCFWYEFILFATHAFAEQYATIAFFCALTLLHPNAGNYRLAIAGFLLGLTVAFRLPYLPLVAVFGLCLLSAYPRNKWAWGIGGGFGALLLAGVIDYGTWGRWWHSLRLYNDLFLFNDILAEMKTAHRGHPPLHAHFTFMQKSSLGLYLLALPALLLWRRLWCPLATAGIVLIVHTVLANKEYTNLFILWPLLWTLIAAVATAERWRQYWRGTRHYLPRIIGGLALTVSVAISASGIPNQERHHVSGVFTSPKDGWRRSDIFMRISRDLARRPKDEVRGVLWWPDGLLFSTGGYYHLHHQVPLFFPNTLKEHKALLQQQPDIRTWASHIIAAHNQHFDGFIRDPAYEESPFAVFVNTTPQAVKTPPDFATDILPNEWRQLEPTAKRMGIEFASPQPALLFRREDQ